MKTKNVLAELKDTVFAVFWAPIYWGMCFGTGLAWSLDGHGEDWHEAETGYVFKQVYNKFLRKETIEGVFENR